MESSIVQSSRIPELSSFIFIVSFSLSLLPPPKRRERSWTFFKSWFWLIFSHLSSFRLATASLALPSLARLEYFTESTWKIVLSVNVNEMRIRKSSSSTVTCYTISLPLLTWTTRKTLFLFSNKSYLLNFATIGTRKKSRRSWILSQWKAQWVGRGGGEGAENKLESDKMGLKDDNTMTHTTRRHESQRIKKRKKRILLNPFNVRKGWKMLFILIPRFPECANILISRFGKDNDIFTDDGIHSAGFFRDVNLENVMCALERRFSGCVIECETLSSLVQL